MSDFLIYNLKVGVCLAVFYLFYKLLLSRETFHRFNRVVLLVIIILSFILPLCVVTVYKEAPATVEVAKEAVLDNGPLTSYELSPAQVDLRETSVAVSITTFDWMMLARVLFGVGILASLVYVIVAVMRILNIVRSGERERLDKKVVLVKKLYDIMPFSWLKYIVVSKVDYDENGEEIVAHEMAHIQFRHSYDLLATDICSCLQWFNPAMWLLKQELRNIHEYEADRRVLESGVDAKKYQLLLIKKAVGAGRYSIANSLNHSKLKNRITMMLQKKSSMKARAKVLFVLPLLFVGLTAFAETVYTKPKGDNKAQQTKQNPKDKVTKKNVEIVINKSEDSNKAEITLLDDNNNTLSSRTIDLTDQELKTIGGADGVKTYKFEISKDDVSDSFNVGKISYKTDDQVVYLSNAEVHINDSVTVFVREGEMSHKNIDGKRVHVRSIKSDDLYNVTEEWDKLNSDGVTMKLVVMKDGKEAYTKAMKVDADNPNVKVDSNGRRVLTINMDMFGGDEEGRVLNVGLDDNFVVNQRNNSTKIADNITVTEAIVMDANSKGIMLGQNAGEDGVIVKTYVVNTKDDAEPIVRKVKSSKVISGSNKQELRFKIEKHDMDAIRDMLKESGASEEEIKTAMDAIEKQKGEFQTIKFNINKDGDQFKVAGFGANNFRMVEDIPNVFVNIRKGDPALKIAVDVDKRGKITVDGEKTTLKKLKARIDSIAERADVKTNDCGVELSVSSSAKYGDVEEVKKALAESGVVIIND